MELRAGSKPSCYSECQRQKPDVRLVLPTKPRSWAELTQPWGKLNGALCACGVAVYLWCVSASSAPQLAGGHGRAGVAVADTTPGEATRAASWCSRGSSSPWCVCWRKQGYNLPQGPLPKDNVAKMAPHLAPSTFSTPPTLSQQTLHCEVLSMPSWFTSAYVAYPFNLCYKSMSFSCDIALNYFSYFELNNQEWDDNYVLESQEHPTVQRKPKVALSVVRVQTPATRTGN